MRSTQTGIRDGCRPFELDPGLHHCRPIVLSSALRAEVDARLPLRDRALLRHLVREALVQLALQLVSALQFQVVRGELLRTGAPRSQQRDPLFQEH